MAFPDPIDLFLDHAAARPGQPAVVGENGSLSYEVSFARQAHSVSSALTRWTEPRVLIALPAGPDAYAAMIAAGLAGGFYTPLNIEAPEAKLRKIARALQPDVIIASGELGHRLQLETPEASVIAPSDVPDGQPDSGSRAATRPRT